ncbi:MAG: lasso peptide biosynthesis B2 protein [Gaiellaceae bacterium]
MTRLKVGLLAVRMGSWALALPILKRVVPLQRLAQVMRDDGCGPRDLAYERQIVALSSLLARLRPPRFRDNCLERSLLAYRFLTRANADPRLVVGVRLGEAGVLGHAWVTLDGEPIHESPAAISEFSQVVEFGPEGAASSSRPEARRLPDVWV